MAAPAGAPPFSQSQQAMNASLANGGGNASRPTATIDQLPGETQTLLTSLFQGAGLQQVLAATVNTQRSGVKPIHPSPLKPSPALLQQSDTHQTTPPISWAGRKRQRADVDDNTKRRRSMYAVGKTIEKQNKGLRHFSQLVCEKVREKGTTTYNEVADELVKELGDDGAGGSEHIDQKNIRRRVYDALNVLMAMNIISKEKKEIHWIGLPTNSVQECEHIQDELAQFEQRIQTKNSELHTLLIQILTMKALVRRNKARAERGETPTQNSAIGLPFILVNTGKNTTIDCSISSDKSEYVFNFDHAFELHQDFQVLKKMGLDFSLSSGSCTAHGLAQAKSMLPKVFESTLDEMAHVSALQSAPSFPVSSLPPATNTPSQLPHSTSTSTPTSCSLPMVVNPLLTPLLGDNSNGASSVSSSMQSPLASLIGMTKTPPSAMAMAAAISSLQQLQQQAAQSPLQRTLTHSSLTPTGLSSHTVTARPLNFAPSLLPTGRGSPTVQPKTMAPIMVSSPSMHTGMSLATKIVTAQPIPNATSISVAEILASLQKQPTIASSSSEGPSHNGGLPPEVNPLQTQSVSSANAVSSGMSS